MGAFVCYDYGMSIKRYSIDEQKQIFADLWDKFSVQIKNGNGTVDFPNGDELSPHHVTTIIRLPQAIAGQLRAMLADICPNDYHYPPSDLHLTLINLDKLLRDTPEVDWQSLGLHISEYVSKLPALEFEVGGINVFPTTLFAEIYEKTGVLEAYRNAIIQGVGSYLSVDLNPDDYGALVPGITFTNVVRFKSTPLPSVIDPVTKLRTMSIGSFKPTTFELVVTNRLLSIDGTAIKTTVALSQ